MLKFKIAIALFTILATQLSFADVLISERDVVVKMEVSEKTLKWTDLGYSNYVVKILVPELADVTILDHRNVGEDAPCLVVDVPFVLGASEILPGALIPTGKGKIQEVLQGNPAIEDITLNIKLSKAARLTGNVCKIYLTEWIAGELRGFSLFHSKQTEIGERHPDDCR